MYCIQSLTRLVTLLVLGVSNNVEFVWFLSSTSNYKVVFNNV